MNPGAPPADEPARPAPAEVASGGMPRNVVALGFTSLLTDVSSEMILPVLPLFVTGVLRASVASLGVIEGVAECTSALLRVGSGWLSDRVGRRKPFILFGYGLSTVAKATLAVAGTWPAVLGLRFADRVGKGLRNPPRDALIADSVPRERMGNAFGLHRAMDTLGAAIGPLAAFAILTLRPEAFRLVFAVSAVPAVLAVVVLALFVRAPRHLRASFGTVHAEWRALGGPFKRFLLVDGFFRLGFSSLAFIILRTREAGFSDAQVPLVYLVYNLVFAALSWPIGRLSDRIGRRSLLLGAYVLYAATYALLAWQATPLVVIVGLAALGIHSAMLEGQQRSLIADLVPADRRATAYGVYYTVVGLALLPASIVAGVLWDRFGARTTFAVDGALALLAAVLFVVLLPAAGEWRDRHGAHAG